MAQKTDPQQEAQLGQAEARGRELMRSPTSSVLRGPSIGPRMPDI